MDVIVEIDADGKVSVKVQGAKGASCKDATKALEAALGMVERDEKTAEFFEKAKTEQKLGR